MSSIKKVLLCTDKFKNALSAQEVGDFLKKGLLSMPFEEELNMGIEVEITPLADGGEGSLEVISHSINFDWVEMKACDPIGRPINAKYGRIGEVAYIEMSKASGLMLLSESERNPLSTNTFGTGQMINHAIDHGAKEVLLFVGGSATNDAGLGAATALGYKFYDETNEQININGSNLQDITRIEDHRSKKIKGASFKIISDVLNPFYGPNGATYSYGLQKGLPNAYLQEVDQSFKHLASLFKEYKGIDIQNLVSAGAAGGFSGGFQVLFGARSIPGFQFISSLLQLEKQIQRVDLVITGEGKIDSNSLQGKVISGVVAISKAKRKPCIVVCGQNEIDILELSKIGFSRVYEVYQGESSILESIANTPKRLVEIGFQIALDFLE